MPHSTSDEKDHLLAFLRDRDAECPNCSYNLRDLTKPICPECKEDLVLEVGSRIYPIRWLLITVAPGIFTGITAGVMMVLVALIGLPPNPIPLNAIITAIFFALSTVTSIAIIFMHRRFIRQPQPRQVLWAIGNWVIHLTAFFLFLAYAIFLI